jgi:hypothetical protein
MHTHAMFIGILNEDHTCCEEILVFRLAWLDCSHGHVVFVEELLINTAKTLFMFM